MSLREAYPKAKVPNSHFFFTLSRGESMRTLALRPASLYAAASVIPLLAAWYLGATVYLIFRDDMLGAMMKRQAEMQYAYEDRLAAMRGQLDRVTSRQLLDQDTVDGKVHELLSRQAQLESRGAIVASLADAAGVSREAFASLPRGLAGVKRPLLPPSRPAGAVSQQIPSPNALPANVSAFAPVPSPASTSAFDPLFAKPRPEDAARGAETDAPAKPFVSGDAGADVPVAARLNKVAGALDRIEFQQIASLSAMERKARASAQKLRAAFADAGLRDDRLTAPAAPKGAATGGPFVPLKVDPHGSSFEREVNRLQVSLVAADKLKRLLPYMPLRAPLPGQPDVTSTFGVRVDPFIGRAAMHTGIDFRDDHGAPIRATAAGKVVSAGRSGGYGNMVEIDHGNGLSTRYGHLSAISVDEDQWINAGAVVGKLGSTGRSTGPHLHYETRIDGEAVNPTRFLKAGERLFGE